MHTGVVLRELGSRRTNQSIEPVRSTSSVSEQPAPRKTRPSAHTDTLAFQKAKSLPAHVYVRARRRSLPVVAQRRRRAADVVGQSHAKVRLRDKARHEEVVRRVVRGEGELPS